MSKITVRSPSYPSMSLQAAVEAVKAIEGKYRSAPVDREVAARLMGFTSLNGSANKALAALSSYGLVERSGKGMMRVTSRAKNIIHPNDQLMRIEALRAAADEPKLFQGIRDRFPDLEVPPEEGVRQHLNREGFNASAIAPATRAFMETAEFLQEEGVSESHREEDADDSESEEPGAKFGGATVGDLIQWESGGVLQFRTPQRVRWVSPDGAWVAVEDSDTGIPMSEVMVETRGPATPPPVPPATPPAQTQAASQGEGMRKAVFPIDGGDVTLIFPKEIDGPGLKELGQYLDIFLKKEQKKASEAPQS